MGTKKKKITNVVSRFRNFKKWIRVPEKICGETFIKNIKILYERTFFSGMSVFWYRDGLFQLDQNSATLCKLLTHTLCSENKWWEMNVFK